MAPSVRRSTSRAALLLACGLLLAALAAGCQTTQETATLRQAESKRILAARKHRQEHRAKAHEKGGKKP